MILLITSFSVFIDKQKGSKLTDNVIVFISPNTNAFSNHYTYINCPCDITLVLNHQCPSKKTLTS